MSNSADLPQFTYSAPDTRLGSRNSVGDLEQQMSAAQNAADAAKAKAQQLQSIAAYNNSGAKQEGMQGQQLIQKGAASQTVGAITTTTGFGMIAAGMAMLIPGLIPGLGAGAGAAAATMISTGTGMTVQGMGQQATGRLDQNQGQAAMARAQEMLDAATDSKILGQEEAKIAEREMQRSRTFEFKKTMFDSMKDGLKPMLENSGFDTENIDDEQMMQVFDKMLGDAALILQNGGNILETDLTAPDGSPLFTDDEGQPLVGPRYFMRDDKGDFYIMDVYRDDNGNVITGTLGEPLFETEGAQKVEDSDLKDYLQMHYAMADQLELLAGELTVSEFDTNGDLIRSPLDIRNKDHAREFTDLIMKTQLYDVRNGSVPSPLKVIITEDGEAAFQEWDWFNDVAIGPPVTMTDISGGEISGEGGIRNDMESYQLAMDTSAAALSALGLNTGGSRFNTLSTIGDYGLSPTPNSAGAGLGLGSTTSRDSTLFQAFMNGGVVEDSVLESQTADDVASGNA